MVARSKQKPRRRDRALVIKRACLPGGCGNGSRPATTTPAAELVAQIAAMEGVGLPARAPGSGSSADQPDPSGTRQARCINWWAGGWFRRGNFASPSPAQFAFHPFARRTGLFRCALHLGFRLPGLLRFVANLVILSSCNPSPVLFSAACALLSHHDLPAKRCHAGRLAGPRGPPQRL